MKEEIDKKQRDLVKQNKKHQIEIQERLERQEKKSSEEKKTFT